MIDEQRKHMNKLQFRFLFNFFFSLEIKYFLDLPLFSSNIIASHYILSFSFSRAKQAKKNWLNSFSYLLLLTVECFIYLKIFHCSSPLNLVPIRCIHFIAIVLCLNQRTLLLLTHSQSSSHFSFFQTKS